MSARRLDQLLSSLGYCSRSEVKHLLREERVLVDGAPARNPAQKVNPDAVRLDGEPLDHPEGLYVLFHKPLGYVCSHRDSPNIYRFFPERWLLRKPAISTVGRLDKDTSGILLLTDDGLLLHRLTSPKYHLPRVYDVTLAEPLRGDEAQVIGSGTLMLEDDDKPCLPAQWQPTGARVGRLTLHEGRYHQVRRMFAALGNHVSALHRSAFGPLTLGELAPGEYRDLRDDELALLNGGHAP
ncbi:pseudouridine synthase [Thermithiobacillus plumbiphilus]|uniref:Pseudouridine synthase n=1 Tax=Thermithiobacillus plumbiphilus TaxID=1729899 RepID=A0ABU9D9A1_9PROT